MKNIKWICGPVGSGKSLLANQIRGKDHFGNFLDNGDDVQTTIQKVLKWNAGGIVVTRLRPSPEKLKALEGFSIQIIECDFVEGGEE